MPKKSTRYVPNPLDKQFSPKSDIERKARYGFLGCALCGKIVDFKHWFEEECPKSKDELRHHLCKERGIPRIREEAT